MSNPVLSAVKELLPGFVERTEGAEQARRLPDETMTELVEHGVFRMLQPARFGGAEADPVHFFEVVRAISGACGSTGWVAGVLGCHPWQVALFPEEVQQEVWGKDPDTLVSSSYAPVGRLSTEEGGYRMSGRWQFSSGCDHATWAALGGLVVDGEGRPLDFLTVLLPRSDYAVVDVWDTMGLRGTGSNDIVVEDVFVPAHRVMRNYDQAHLHAPGQQLNSGPLYRMPFATIFTTAITSPVVGAAQGAYDTYMGAMRNRVRLSLGGGRFAEDEHAQVAVARAASEIDAAVLQLDRNVADIYACAVRGEEIPADYRFRTRRDQVRATERALLAVDVLFKTAGGNSLRRGNPIERAWRDAHAGSVHVANDVERTLAMVGKHAFGLSVEDNLI